MALEARGVGGDVGTTAFPCIGVWGVVTYSYSSFIFTLQHAS